MTTAFITCAGRARIFAGYGHRNLVPIYGEPLLLRTIRQCRGHGIVPIIIVSPGDDGSIIRSAAPDVPFLFSANPTCLCDSMREFTRAPLGNHCLFLFGDVPYSEGSWKRILDVDQTQIRCLGSFLQGEMFAISFPFSRSDEVLNHLNNAVESKASGKTDGTAWQFYRSVINVLLERHLIEDTTFVDIEDGFTTDLDFPDQYDAFKKEHRA